VYERKVGERVLTLGNERWRFQESAVLYDVETGTQWVQATGQALHGELERHALTTLPVELTRLGAFRAGHPDARVLTGARPNAPRGRVFVLDRAHLAEFVLVLRVGAAVRAYPFELLDRHGLIEDEVDAAPVAAVFARAPDVMRVYRREAGGRPLALELVRRERALVLRERGGTREWDAATGRALGDAAAPPLEALPAVAILRERLRQHFRRATIWAEPPPKPPGK
jgi:hypothetical protein